MICRVYQAKTRNAVLSWFRRNQLNPRTDKALPYPCSFDNFEDFWGWVGDALKPVRLKSGQVVWLTDKVRTTKKNPDGSTAYLQREDWLGYRWDLEPAEVLFQEMFLSQKGFRI